MDIFKLIFEHDITLEQLSGNENPRNKGIDDRERDREARLEAFLKPQLTYHRYYFTGTRIRENRFGLSVLETWPEIIERMDQIFNDRPGGHSGWHRTNGSPVENLNSVSQFIQPFEVLISGPDSEESVRNELVLDEKTGIRERFKPLTRLLDNDHMVLIPEKAHHGIDLHLFSRHNLYESFFATYQAMTSSRFRYFSINGRRVSSERQFYFETWTLDRPPHGFQEVTPDARIR